MLVKELIEHLKLQDQEAMVVISGYEGGVYDADSTSSCTIALNVNPTSAWYLGPHELCGIWASDDREHEGYTKVKAVFIS